MSKTLSYIKSISDLENLVKNWEKKFFGPGLGYPFVWYRGQGVDADPQPGILRSKFLSCCDKDEVKISSKAQRLQNREKTINIQFRRMSSSLVPADCSDVMLYFLAQHHGLPTRLLDWTTNPLSALYFAVSNDVEENGALYVLNPKDLGELSYFQSQQVEATVGSVFDGPSVTFAPKILPVMPDLVAGRILNQNSCFTLHTPEVNLDGADETTPCPICFAKLEKHIVPKEKKEELLITLRRLGVTGAMIYADLDNVTKELRSAWKL
jgi:hypothetical protein